MGVGVLCGVGMCVCAYACMCVCFYACMYVCMYVCFVHVCAFMHVWIVVCGCGHATYP